MIYSDEEKILKETKDFMDSSKTSLRIGTGEFGDSLAIPEAASLAKKLIALFSSQQKHLLELKTKTLNIDDLLDLKHNRQTVIGWSVNPQKIIDTEEPETSSLIERLKAAKRCGEAGYLIAFHFDPIIYFLDWGREYKEAVEQIFEYVSPAQIAWISMGALRFPLKQKEIIEKKHTSRIDFKYFIRGKDNKLRYPPALRIDLFTHLCETINKVAPEAYLYLCMEEIKVWEKLAGLTRKGNFAKFFEWRE